MSGDTSSVANIAPMFSNRTGQQHDLYLTGPILGAATYVEWFHLLRNCSSRDEVRFHINSEGGYLYTALQLMSAMRECEAHLVASVEGCCMSAATLIMLECDSFLINEHCSFMFHNYSGGVSGKGGEMYASVSFEKGWSEELLHSTYKGFLSKKEIKNIIQGSDIYLGTNDVIGRLLKRAKKLEKAVTIKES